MNENIPLDAIPEDQFQTYEEKYGSPSEQAKLFAQKAAEAATFGLSTKLLAEQGLLDIEAAKRREEVSPITGLAGEVAGIAGTLAIPGAPVSGVSRAAEAVTAAAEPSIAKIVSKIANPETASRVNKILTKAGSAAIGSALEGGVYGVGSAISEDSLGESRLNAESLLHHIGIGSLYGGLAGGAVGGVLGALQKPISKVVQNEKDLVAATGAELGNNYINMVTSAGLPEQEKEKLLAGLAELKPNVKEIDSAASRLGVDTLVGQRANDETIQKLYSILGDSVSPFGIQERQKVQTGFGVIKEKLGQALGGEAPTYSKAQLGEKLAESIAGKFKTAYEPIANSYDVAEKILNKVNITDEEKISIIEAIEKVINKEMLTAGTEQYIYAKQIQNAIVNLKTYKDVDTYAKVITKGIKYELKSTAQAIRNEIEKTSVDILEEELKKAKPTDPSGQIGIALEEMKKARPAYAGLITNAKQLAKVAGNSNIKGPADFIDFLTERQTPEKLVDKLFQKQNYRFLSKFQKDFPEEWNLIKNYQKGVIFESSLKDGAVDVNKVLKQVKTLQPELKNALFTKKEIQDIADAKTWIEALPPKFNTSNTAVYSAWQSFFENPTKATIQTLRDIGFKGMFKGLGLTAKEEQQLNLLKKIEKTKIQTELQIKSGVKSIFQVIDKSIKAEVSNVQEDDTKVKENLEKYSADPELFINDMEAKTQNLYRNAPKIAGDLQEAATRATLLLAQNLPKVPEKKPLGFTYKLSKSDVARFGRYLDAINNPIKILDQVKYGNLTKEYVESVSTVYPTLFNRIKENLTDELTSIDEETIKKMPYKVKMAISMLLGADMANGLSAQSIVANQSKLGQTVNKQSGVANGVRPTQKGLDKISIAKMSQTPLQKEQAKG